jgi:hypothetical protein
LRPLPEQNGENERRIDSYQLQVITTIANVKKAFFLDVTPCGSCKTDVSEECIAFMIRVKGISEIGTSTITSNFFLHRTLKLLVTATFDSLLTLSTLMME